MTSPDCLFCGIVAGTVPSRTVYADEHTVAFMDINPATSGHLLVVPRTHCRDLLDITPADLAACSATAQELARRSVERLGADGVNLLSCCGEDAWQTVFHFHLHVIPRYALRAVGAGRRDELRLPWIPTPGDDAEIDEAAALLAT